MGLRLYRCSRLVLRVLFRLGGGLEVRGRENVPPDGPLIVASNHASFLDPMVLGAAFDRPLGYLARKTLFSNPVFSRFIRAHFAFPLDREGDIREALRAFSQRLGEGRAVVMFPEGTRTVTGKLAEIKEGVGMIAVRSVSPVIPVYLWGSYQSWPRNTRWPRPHRLKVLIGTPVRPCADLDRSNRRGEQERIASEVRDQLHRLEAEAWEGEAPPVPLALPAPATPDQPPPAPPA